MKKVTSVKNIRDPYSKRILTNIINQDPLRVYRTTPHDLQKLLRGMSYKHLHTPLKRGRWSIARIVSHLFDAEVVMSFRLRMAVAQSGSPLQAYDQDTWAGALYYDKADCRDKLKSFSTLRGANVTLLKCLSPKEWQRYGMHEERGKETIERMVQMLAGHDVNHLRQIAEIRQNLLRAQH